MLLKGVIDCPDLPLNVSRSALQNDGFVNKDCGLYFQERLRISLPECSKQTEKAMKNTGMISVRLLNLVVLKMTKFAEKIGDYVSF